MLGLTVVRAQWTSDLTVVSRQTSSAWLSEFKSWTPLQPHGSLESMLPANTTSIVVAIQDEDNTVSTPALPCSNWEIVLPRAIDYFQQNTEATVYQMLWEAVHGTTYIHFGKPARSMEAPGARRDLRRKNWCNQRIWSCITRHGWSLMCSIYCVHMHPLGYEDWSWTEFKKKRKCPGTFIPNFRKCSGSHANCDFKKQSPTLIFSFNLYQLPLVFTFSVFISIDYNLVKQPSESGERIRWWEEPSIPIYYN